MSRPLKSGRILSSGVVKAKDIAATLGLQGAEPETRPPEALTPAQAMNVAKGRDPGPGAPGFDEVTIKGGRPAFEHFGRPDLYGEAHLRDGPSLEPPELPPEPKPQRSDWDAADAAAENREHVEDLVAEYKDIERRLAIMDAEAPPPDTGEAAELQAQVAEGRRMIDDIKAKLGQ
jgi:hypothetical protein